MLEALLWVLAIWAGFTVLAVAIMVWAICTAIEEDEQLMHDRSYTNEHRETIGH